MLLTNFKSVTKDEFYKYIDNIIPTLMKKHSIPGVAISLIDNNSIGFTEVYGYANKNTGKLISSNTIFQVASISKTLTAWGIVKLAQNGLISLDDPVDKYLKSWHLPKSKYNNDVTIRRILNHTAGLSVHGYKGELSNKKEISLIESLSGKNNRRNKVKVIQQPGISAIYSGGGYTILQLLIEDIMEMSFSEYMKNEILTPMEMNESAFQYDDNIDENSSKCYNYFGKSIQNYVFAEKAAAGFYTTINDMTKFIIETLNGINEKKSQNGVLTSEKILLMLSRINREIPYGLGYHLISTLNGKVAMNYGVNRGWRSRFMILPNTKDAIIVLTNSDLGDNLIKEISLKWIQWKIGNISDFYKKSLCLEKSNKYTNILKTYFEYIS